MHCLQGQLNLKRQIPHDSLHLILSLYKNKLYKNIEAESSEILRVCEEYTRG